MPSPCRPLHLLDGWQSGPVPAAIAILLAMLANLSFKTTLAFTLGGAVDRDGVTGRDACGGWRDWACGIMVIAPVPIMESRGFPDHQHKD